jgi:hypothetical protein
MGSRPHPLFDPTSPLNRLRACTRPEDKLRGYFHWLGFRKERSGASSPPRAAGRPSFLVLRAGDPEKPLSADLEVSLLSEPVAGAPGLCAGERRLALDFRLRDSRDFPRREVACRAYLLDEAVLERLGQRLRARRMRSGKEGREPGQAPQGEVRALTALPDGCFVSWGDGEIRLSDPETGAACNTVARHAGPVVALAALPDGRFASGDADGTIRLWDPAAGTNRTVSPHPGPLSALAALPDGRLASAGKEGRICLRHPGGGAVQTLDLRRPVVALAALPDGRLVSADVSGMTQLWDPVTGAAETAGARGRVRAVLPDGRLVFQDQRDNVRLWDPAAHAEQVVALPEAGRVLAVLPDGRLALADEEGHVRLAALPAAKPGARVVPSFLPALFRDDFLGSDFEAARILSAIPEVEGTVDAQGHGRLARLAVPDGEPAATLDDLYGRLFFAVVVDV